MPVPKQKPGRSKQDYRTPPEFLQALKNKLGISEFMCDVAATKDNAVASRYFTEEDNALEQYWGFGEHGWVYCNPPFGDIKPWLAKAYSEVRNNQAKVAMLVPASVGANWWLAWVHEVAYVLFLNGRLTFVGETTPYPKDCAVLLYAPTFIGGGGYQIWDWKRDSKCLQ